MEHTVCTGVYEGLDAPAIDKVNLLRTLRAAIALAQMQERPVDPVLLARCAQLEEMNKPASPRAMLWRPALPKAHAQAVAA